MKYLLDTNTFSLLLRREPSVVRAVKARSRSDILLPMPVVAEIEYGLARLQRSRRKETLQQRFDVFLGEFPRCAWTDDVSRAYGKTKADLERHGRRIEDFDVAIAAHALAHDAILVTEDRRHMNRVKGLQVESWTTS